MTARAFRIGMLLVGILACVLVTWVLVASQDRVTPAQRAEDQAHVRKVEADNAALAKQVKALGGQPIVQPKTPNIRYVPVPGPSGRPGKDGESIKGDTGPAGRDGNDGAPGADSTVPGPKGDTGPAGESVKGDTGRGIKSVDCNDADEFVIHYDDGTEQNVDGSRCRTPRLPGDP